MDLILAAAVLAACLGLRWAGGSRLARLRKHGCSVDRQLGTTTPKRLLLVTAHPDDECMFFVPAVRSFIRAGWSVHLLCFTTGTARLGAGLMRGRECGWAGHDAEAGAGAVGTGARNRAGGLPGR